MQINLQHQKVVKWLGGTIGTGGITKAHKETLGSNGYVHHLSCGNGFTDIYICQNKISHFQYMQFIVHRCISIMLLLKKEKIKLIFHP